MRIPVRSWCEDVDPEAMRQAIDLACHPKTLRHVALMPDCHVGYGMPIGGVIACDNAVIPNAVGVDIGCGMCAVRTSLKRSALGNMPEIRELLNQVREHIPLGEGHSHILPVEWHGFKEYLENVPEPPGWMDERGWTLAALNLGSLGGGNHFIEIQYDEDDNVWLMLHSGSRNLGYRIAEFYHQQAVAYCKERELPVPNTQLAYLPADSKEGLDYIRDMNFALQYALENRARMMQVFKNALSDNFSGISFEPEINIHHNFASLERIDDCDAWIHRKGATSAGNGQLGIIPGSMGTASYIVRGLGNPDSFESCSHGAGRKFGRTEACRVLSVEQCDQAMTGIVFDRWKAQRRRAKSKGRGKNLLDLSEAPPAYKDIKDVIASQFDLVEPLIKLLPLGVLKG